MIIAKDEKILVKKMTLGAYDTNAYILACNQTGESAIIDAPAGAATIIKALEGTKPKHILLTHDHYDHTGVITSLRSRLKTPLATHEFSSFQLKAPPEIFLKDGDIIRLGNLRISVLHTPGHTPGSLCFKAGKYLFAGDTIFPGGPGHTDTPDDFTQILDSITKKIYVLPDNTMILPGHGEGITVKQSKEEYAVFATKAHDKSYGDVTWLS